MSANPPTFILIDGHSLAFRAYYAYAKGRDGGLRTSTGIPTSVCYGFFINLLSVMQVHKPESLAIAFDLNLPTFRHEADDTYKADRADTPADFIEELKNLQELLSALSVPVVTCPGYEADDVLGTLAVQGAAAGYRVKILSGDRDLFQLVDTEKNISVLYLSSGKGSTPTEMGPEEVKEKLGIPPTQVVDYKALCGDPSDNIPGVKGIGEKTAVKLLAEYGSLDGIYAALPDIKGANQKKLEEGKSEAYHSQHMAKIVLDVPLEVDLADCQLQGFDRAAIEPVLKKLEFQKFLNQLEQLQQQFGGVVAVQQNAQPADTQTSAKKTAKQKESTENAKQLSLFDQPTSEEAAEPAEIAIQPTAREPVPINPQIIDTPQKLKQLVKRLKTFTKPDAPVAWDTETTDLEPRDAKLVGIGCCWGAGAEDVAYIPVGHTAGTQLDLNIVLETLRPILEENRYYKVLQNSKFDRLVLLCQGIKLGGVVFDTMLASYVIEPEEKHNLTDLSKEYLKYDFAAKVMIFAFCLAQRGGFHQIASLLMQDYLKDYKGVVSKSYKDLNIPKGKTIADLDIAAVADYCGMDVYATLLLLPKLQAELEEAPKLREVFEIEMSLEPVLAEMEYTGIRIDTGYLQELSQQMEKTLQAIEEEAYESAGEKFNLGSPKQLSQLLFEKLGLDTKKSRKTKTGGYSTDAAVLEKLEGDHAVVDAILQHRTLSKLKSTYVDALPQLVRKDTRRVHTDFNQTVTATGRLSSSNPNLQNIPIRTEFSRQIRKAFLPETGWMLLSADYSQIELRILAHLSQEPVLVEAYQNNRDVHSVTAQLLFEKETVTSEERRMGKTINFGVIYGMGSARFARAIGKTTAEGKEFIDRFYKRYPKVFEYLEQKKNEAIAQGYVETLIGRRRYFKFEGQELRSLRGCHPSEIDRDILKKLTQLDAQLLRAAANAPIQGSSADIIKIAMVKLHEVLKNYQARLLLQVHDELVFEVPPSEWEELQPKIKSEMENAVPLSVPLLVDVRAGQNWMDAK